MVNAKQKSGFSITLSVRDHTLVSDVLQENGGKDEGPNPHELLEAALGACTSMTLQMYARRKQWKLSSADVSVRFISDERKERIVIERVITLSGDLTQDERSQLMAIAEKCPIHKVLTRGAQIDTKEFL